MKNKNMIQIGGILFFIGVILIIISWYYTYPIHLTSISDVTFFQFYPSLWPGLILSFFSLFLIAYYCKNKIIIAICSSLFPVLLYICTFFFYYIPSSDSGAVRSMFQIFQKTGINSQAISYFQLPTYFSLNEIIHQVVGVNEKGIAVISFILYGFLLGLFLYLFFDNLKTRYNNGFSPFFLVILYFIGMVSFLNYQWVPQTLALVYFFLIIMISTYLRSSPTQLQWKIMVILIFIPLVLVHAFIPVIFLSFFGIFTLKRRYLLQIFLVILSIYLIYILYASTNLPLYIETFRQSIVGFNSEYAASVSVSFKEPQSILNQLISFSNRLIVPMVWILCIIGTAVLFFKRKIESVLISLGFAGGIYLAIGMFYSILGMRATQIILIPITFGFTFFSSKLRKPATAFIIVILLLVVSVPMRMAYNPTQFQLDEEANACNFLVNNTINTTTPKVAIGQVNYGYFVDKYIYIKNGYPLALRPGESGFFNLFKDPLKENEYVFYNSNLGKEILTYGFSKEQLDSTFKQVMDNNKIYDCGNTFIINGINNK